MAGPVETRIVALANEVFVPADMAATAFTPEIKARCASLVLLVHAEIEFAIETACRRVAGTLRTAADPATAILIWGMIQLVEDGEAGRPRTKRTVQSLVDAYDRLVTKNHGIKEANIKGLLIPLGVELAPLNTEISALETFGTERGDLAHRPLADWNTSNLPSTQVTNARQAGQAADTIVAAIQTKHSLIRHSSKPPRVWRSVVAKSLRSLARLVER